MTEPELHLGGTLCTRCGAGVRAAAEQLGGSPQQHCREEERGLDWPAAPGREGAPAERRTCARPKRDCLG